MSAKRTKTRTRVRSADTTTLPLFESARRRQQTSTSTSATHTADRPRRISTGLASVDRIMRGGFPVGAATLVAARHQDGATSLLIGAALAALQQRPPVASVTERLTAEKLRGRFVVLESRVNGHRFRAGFVSAEDRVALAAARERIPWNLMSVTAQPKLTASHIEANIFSYRPWLVLADVKPKPATERTAAGAQAALLEGIAELASIARQQGIALVLRMVLPKGHHPPDLLELPGLGAAVLPFGAAILLHRERRGDDQGDEATATSRAEARIVRLNGAEIEPRVVPLRFDQRFAGLLDA